MNKEEFKKITEYLDKMVILHQTTGEPINKDLDISIRLSVAYEELELESKKQKEVIDRLNFIKNRKNQGASQENINKMAIEFVNSWLKEVSK